METPIENFKPQLRLIIQASIPIEDVLEGENLYRELKGILLNYSFDITLNGQIMKILEHCCKDRKEQKTNDKNT